MACSELLDEEREPFEVLPGGCIGPSLLVALRVLLASDADFCKWQSLDDALQLCSVQQPPEGSADRQHESGPGCKTAEQPGKECRSEIGHHPRSSRKRGAKEGTAGVSEPVSERPEAKKQRSEGARDLDTAGRNGMAAAKVDCDLDDGEQHNGDCHTKKTSTGAAPEQGASATGELPAQIGNTDIRAARQCGVLTGDMCLAVARCIRQRLQRYRHASLAEDLRELEKEEGLGQRGKGRNESSRARVAALRLVVTEKELLHAALESLE